MLKYWLTTSVAGSIVSSIYLYTRVRGHITIEDFYQVLIFLALSLLFLLPTLVASWFAYRFLQSKNFQLLIIKLSILAITIAGIYITLRLMGGNALSKILFNSYASGAIIATLVFKKNQVIKQ